MRALFQNTCALLFFMFYLVMSAYAGNKDMDYNIKYDYQGNIIIFDRYNIFFEVFDENKKKIKECYPSNYNEVSDKGLSFLTSDHEAVVFQSSGRFILTGDVIDKCDAKSNKDVEVYPSVNIGMIVDMNFKEKIVLMYHYIPKEKGDVPERGRYLAEISRFVKRDYTSSHYLDEVSPKKTKYLLSGKYFFSGNYNNAFLNGYAGEFDLTSGVISPNAKYVDPFGLGCDINKVDGSRPGVYEMATGRRVVFNMEEKETKEDIARKCRLLLDGSAKLQELGGYLSK